MEFFGPAGLARQALPDLWWLCWQKKAAVPGTHSPDSLLRPLHLLHVTSIRVLEAFTLFRKEAAFSLDNKLRNINFLLLIKRKGS